MSVWTQLPSGLDYDFNRVIDDSFSGQFNAAARARGEGKNQVRTIQPSLDVHESKENNLVTATFELPGLKKEDIAIDVHNGRLSVSGAFGAGSAENRNDGYIVRERRSGKFSRDLALPQGVTADSISASLTDGVLTVTFPKSTPEQQATRIVVN